MGSNASCGGTSPASRRVPGLARSVDLAIALVVLVSSAFCQVPVGPRLTVPGDEGCGNPMMESQLWLGVKGMVNKVVAPTTIRVLVTEPNPHVITVKLIGVRAPAGKRAANEAISFLRRAVEGREVEVLLNPRDKYFEQRTGKRVEGWLSSVSIAMIGSGMVAYGHQSPTG
jgi:hypothetical protein